MARKKSNIGNKGGLVAASMAGAAIGAAAAVALGDEVRRKRILKSAALVKDQAMEIIEDYSKERPDLRSSIYRKLGKTEGKISEKTKKLRKKTS